MRLPVVHGAEVATPGARFTDEPLNQGERADDDNGQNWAVVGQALNPSQVRVGALVVAGMSHFWSVVRITAVERRRPGPFRPARRNRPRCSSGTGPSRLTERRPSPASWVSSLVARRTAGQRPPVLDGETLGEAARRHRESVQKADLACEHRPRRSPVADESNFGTPLDMVIGRKRWRSGLSSDGNDRNDRPKHDRTEARAVLLGTGRSTGMAVAPPSRDRPTRVRQEPVPARRQRC